jgi:hypothetical protein
MDTFNFYQDCKVTCWERTRFSIKANSYEEAKAIILSWKDKDVNSRIGIDKDIVYSDYELNPETVEGLSHQRTAIIRQWKSMVKQTSCYMTI